MMDLYRLLIEDQSVGKVEMALLWYLFRNLLTHPTFEYFHFYLYR